MSAPGWFGKIPALGDFVVRRLPPSFVGPWDEWLTTELSDAHAILGDGWADAYRRAPISCFSVGAGVIDESTWHGVLVPSFDRVGREFPLTIAHATDRLSRESWAALIAAGRHALGAGCSADDLDAALLTLRIVQPDAQYAAVSAGASMWWHESSARATAETFDGLPRGAFFRRSLSI